MAAHSTTRALYASYNGSLYQVKRASDGATTNISTLSAGGYANAAAQDSFCAGTTCTITEIYDQSGHGNNLTDAPAGGAAGGPDNLANATAAPTMAGGHKVYGVYVAAGTGYRDDSTSGIATGDNPEGEYAIFDGTHYNGGCCFDYGNAETNNDDNGNGHMEAIYFGTDQGLGLRHRQRPLDHGRHGERPVLRGQCGLQRERPDHRRPVHHRHDRGRAEPVGHPGRQRPVRRPVHVLQRRPSTAGYNPMHKEGAIILGIGGDNSKGSAGTFYEGVMTSGYPSAATENAVQANITSVGYAPYTASGRTTGPIVSGLSSSECVDNNNGSGTNGNKVQIWTCDGNAAAQNWTVNSNGTLTIDGGCMDITGANYSNGTLIELWTCNGGANQQWQA